MQAWMEKETDKQELNVFRITRVKFTLFKLNALPFSNRIKVA